MVPIARLTLKKLIKVAEAAYEAYDHGTHTSNCSQHRRKSFDGCICGMERLGEALAELESE
jgi:hypothetical protein